MPKTEKEWIKVYQENSALWLHDRNPKRPHVKLRSGLHSDGFFYSKPVTDNEGLLRSAVSDLRDLFEKGGGSVDDVECVVGPQTGATRLAEYLSDFVDALTDRGCTYVSPEKNPTDPKGPMIFTDEQLSLVRGKKVLLCEDVITTGGSVGRAVEPIESIAKEVLPFILALVNRSGQEMVDGRKIIALINRHMTTWEPGDGCDLCREGSRAMEAKGDNWKLLNATY